MFSLFVAVNQNIFSSSLWNKMNLLRDMSGLQAMRSSNAECGDKYQRKKQKSSKAAFIRIIENRNCKVFDWFWRRTKKTLFLKPLPSGKYNMTFIKKFGVKGEIWSERYSFVITFWMMNRGWGMKAAGAGISKALEMSPLHLTSFSGYSWKTSLPTYFRPGSYWSKQQWILRIMQTIYKIENNFHLKRIWFTLRFKRMRSDRNWIRWRRRGEGVRLMHPFARLEWNPCLPAACWKKNRPPGTPAPAPG